MPARRYDALSGRVRCRFVHALAVELIGFWQHRWNAERFIIFQTVILQRAQNVIKSCEIRRRIDQRLNAWEAGEHEILAEDTARTCTQYLSNRRGEDTTDHQTNVFHSPVLRGKHIGDPTDRKSVGSPI